MTDSLTILDNMRVIFKSLLVTASVDRSAAVTEFGRLLATRDLDLNLPIHNEEEGRSIGNSLLGECIYLLLCHGRCSYKNEAPTYLETNACVRLLLTDRRVDINREMVTADGRQCYIVHALYRSPTLVDLLPILLDRLDLHVSQPYEWHGLATTLLGTMFDECDANLELVRRVTDHPRFDADFEMAPLHTAVHLGVEDYVELFLATPSIDAKLCVNHEGTPLDIAMKYEGTQYYSAHIRILRALLDSPRTEAPRRVNLVDRPPSSPVVKTILQSARFDVHQFVEAGTES